jgi:ubiquinone/menaquinone biosynthesis C-methylase UbiE
MTNYTVFRERFQDPNHAGDYDESRFGGLIRRLNNRVWLRTVRRCLEEVRPEGYVLDLPIGTGRLTSTFREMDVSTIGIDLSMPMLALARAKGARWVVRANAERLPLRDGAVDGVVCLRFLHHPRDEARAAIFSEMARVARRFVILDYGYRNPLREALRAISCRIRPGRPRVKHQSLADIRCEVEQFGWHVKRIVFLPRVASDKCIVLATV